MNFRRILANADARRVAFVLVAAFLAWLGVGEAKAVQYSDQGAAYIACVADFSTASSHPQAGAPHPNNCNSATSTSNYTCSMRYGTGTTYRACRGFPSTGSSDASYSWPSSASCSSRASITSTFLPKSGSVGCTVGCEFAWYRNSDGTSTAYALGTVCTNEQMPQTCTGDYYWNPILNVCEPATPECPAGQSLNSRGICGPEECPAGMKLQADNTCGPAKEECPAGNIKAPSGECLPGEGQCAAGEARRENGTCGKDNDGDGIADVDDDDPDNDGKESASGGDTCDAPPACNGGAIDCMQVKIQWRIDCNTRRNRNISGGACNAMPVCAGDKCDAMEYASLIQQWRATCALEKLASRGDGEGGGSGSDVVDLLTGPGTFDPNAVGGDTLTDPGPGGGGGGEGESFEPDAGGYGYSRSCPSPPSVTLPGGQIVQFDLGPLCDWVSLAGYLVLILAGLASLRIVQGGMS